MAQEDNRKRNGTGESMSGQTSRSISNVYETMWLQVQEMVYIEKGGAEQAPGNWRQQSADPKRP